MAYPKDKITNCAGILEALRQGNDLIINTTSTTINTIYYDIVANKTNSGILSGVTSDNANGLIFIKKKDGSTNVPFTKNQIKYCQFVIDETIKKVTVVGKRNFLENSKPISIK